jgi:hypothetical protein
MPMPPERTSEVRTADLPTRFIGAKETLIERSYIYGVGVRFEYYERVVNVRFEGNYVPDASISPASSKTALTSANDLLQRPAELVIERFGIASP